MPPAARTIVEINPALGGGLSVSLQKAPIIVGNPFNPTVLNCDPDTLPKWTEQDAVAKYGEILLQQLLASHPGVSDALKSALQAQQGDERHIYFQIASEDAEALYWETLYAQHNDFLALDRRWQIARIARSLSDSPRVPQRFEPPLHVMAILSALGNPSAPEWAELYSAVLKARDAAFPIRVHVLAGEDSLIDTIIQQAKNDPHLTVQPIPDRNVGVENAIENFSPHILHFFCHGRVDYRNPQLELATTVDFDTEQQSSSVVLTRSRLMGVPALRRVWLLTLNCCEGSRAAEDVSSLIFSLVAGGVPAAIGMMEAVDAGAASEFCGYLYPEIFQRIKQTLGSAAAGDIVEIEWASALYGARSAICGRYGGNAAKNREWALPVLYVLPERFQILCAPAITRTEETQNDVIEGWLQKLPPAASRYMRDNLAAVLAGAPVPPMRGQNE
jgi:CHAT domain